MNAFNIKKLNIKSIAFVAVMSVFCAAVCVLLFCLMMNGVMQGLKPHRVVTQAALIQIISLLQHTIIKVTFEISNNWKSGMKLYL